MLWGLSWPACDNPVVIAPLVALVLISPWSGNLSTKLAGISVEEREPFLICRHDPKTGYFAYKTFDCDGGHISVMLTKDRRNVGGAGYDTSRFGRKVEYAQDLKVEDRSLALATGKGVKIGMTKAAVLRRLGKPARSAVRGKKKEFWCALYKQADLDKAGNGRILRNTYVFKGGKLIEISINLDSVPGCGEDSLSDSGWPWTSF